MSGRHSSPRPDDVASRWTPRPSGDMPAVGSRLPSPFSSTRRMPSFPEWIPPMAATLTYERFAGPEWIFERKLDGIRLLAFKSGSEVRLLSRNRLPQDIPAVAE